jgi:hypothetical protein
LAGVADGVVPQVVADRAAMTSERQEEGVLVYLVWDAQGWHLRVAAVGDGTAQASTLVPVLTLIEMAAAILILSEPRIHL